jgi:hypothetical protein
MSRIVMFVAYFKVVFRDLFLEMLRVATKPLPYTHRLPAVKWGI